MSAPSESLDAVCARLRALLGAGGLKPRVETAGTELLSRLESAVRVVVFGLPGAGKGRLINLILGQDLIPEDRLLPTTRLSYDLDQSVTAILQDGTPNRWPGHPMAEIEIASPLFVEIFTPTTILRSFSFMKIVAEETETDQLAAMAWAAGQTDLAIWCTRRFTKAEAALWHRAPQSLKDNGTLVQFGGALPAPAETRDFAATFAVDPATDDVESLAASLSRAAARGRQAMIDHALLFLSRYEPRDAAPPRPAAPAPATAAPSRAAGDASAVAATITPAADRVPSRPLAPGKDAIIAPAPEPRPTHPAEFADLCQGAVALLRQRARDLSKALPGFGPKPQKEVFGHCLETLDALVEQVVTAGAGEIEDLVLDAADAIVLLQSEGGMSQAADSVTLLLQLRRELETRLAA